MKSQFLWWFAAVTAVTVIALATAVEAPGPDRAYVIAGVIALIVLLFVALGSAASRNAARPAHDLRETRDAGAMGEEARGAAQQADLSPFLHGPHSGPEL